MHGLSFQTVLGSVFLYRTASRTETGKYTGNSSYNYHTRNKSTCKIVQTTSVVFEATNQSHDHDILKYLIPEKKYIVLIMTHIEFLGPPGAGKSTIFQNLIISDTFYGGTEDDAVRRVFLEKAGLKYRFPYRVTPSVVRRFFEDAFMEYRFGHSALEDFIRDHPDFMCVLSVAMDSVLYEPEKVFSLCRRSTEQYQLGISTVSERETLCLDEGFAQRAFSILWREPDESFSLKKYFNSVPIPELVVHTDAPVDLCLKRQRERERVVVSKDWETADPKTVQKKSRELCSSIADYLANKTSVVTIENTGTIREAVDEIEIYIS